MILRDVLVKSRRHAPVTRVEEVTAIAGVGLAGDAGASPSSPRHVLLVDQAAADRLGVPPAALWPNLVVDGRVDALVSGTVLRIGDVRIRVTLACECCPRLDSVRAGLARDARGVRGVLGRVITGGTIARDAALAIEHDRLPALDPSWQARVLDVVEHVPDGQVITYARLAELAGVQSTYCRGFAPLLRRSARAHVVIRGAERETAPRWDGAGYFGDPTST